MYSCCQLLRRLQQLLRPVADALAALPTQHIAAVPVALAAAAA
jgi:hypothetical protein